MSPDAVELTAAEWEHPPREAFAKVEQLIASLIGDDDPVIRDGITADAACGQYEGTLACGANIAGNLTTADCPSAEGYIVEIYRINVPANRTFSVRATSSTSHVILVAIQDLQTGTVLSSNYSAGSVTTSYTSGPVATTYAIGIGYVAKFGTGPYTLAVTCETQSPTCSYVGTLSCGSSVLGSLVPSDCGDQYDYDLYQVNLTEGQTIDLSYTGELPGYLEVSYVDGTRGTWQQGTTPLTMRYTAVRSGVHVVMVSTANEYDGRTTAYTVAVACPPGIPCKQRSVRK
ncbi:MAG TPA: hypothetical protein VE010_03560 [Thermoanaerobaculia bacterium]|nr:hypothetical protein [Thermoanaerobaculia bacterium]